MVCVFSLESPHRGDSNEDTTYHFQYKKKIIQNISNTIMSAAMVLFWLGTQECVRTSRGKRAIGVRATEVLLYFDIGMK